MQYDGELTKSEAERKALIDTKNLIMDENGITNPQTYNFISKLNKQIKQNGQ